MFLLRIAIALVASAVGLLLVLPVAVVAAPIWLVSLITRWTSRMLEGPITAWEELIEFEPVIGWKPKPNRKVSVQAGTVFQLSTGPDGWRSRVTLADSDTLVFGDSFAFGYGVSDADFFANHCGGLKIKSVGAQGYNMVQELLWMKRYADFLRNKLVVWFVYYGNDLYENLQPNMGRYRLPFVRSINDGNGWEIVTGHVSSHPWNCTSGFSYHTKLAEICTPGPHADRVFSATEFLLLEGRQVCEQVGGRLVVMGIPELSQLTAEGRLYLSTLQPKSNVNPDYPDKRLRDICRGAGIRFVALSEYLEGRHYDSRDLHWTPEGHRRVGNVIVDAYREIGQRPTETSEHQPVVCTEAG
jgi:hypothetical protein